LPVAAVVDGGPIRRLARRTLHFPSCWASGRTGPVVAALHCSARRPAIAVCDWRRELTFVTGLPAAAHRFRADRPAGASREVEASFPSAFTGRAVPSGGDQPSGPSRCGVGLTVTPVSGRLAHAVFRASRLRLRSLCLMETPSVRVIRGRILSGPAYRARIGPFSRPDRWPRGRRQRSWDFHCALRSFAPRPRVTAPFFVSASNPPAVSRAARREFHRRGIRPFLRRTVGLLGRGSWGLAPRSGRAGAIRRSR